MPKKEEKVTVAKSTIIFKTTDEWFKTLVSGVVETFFPDKELTFSIEIRKYRKGGSYGYCAYMEIPQRIVINGWYIDKGLCGIELAETIAHEIVHALIMRGHDKAFQREVLNIGSVMLDKNGYTEATRWFAEKIIPTLEKSGFKPVRIDKDEYYSWIFGDSSYHWLLDLFPENWIIFLKGKNGQWIGQPCYDMTGVTVNQKAVDTVCQQLEFLDKTVFAEQKPANESPYCFRIYSDDVSPCLVDLFYTLDRVYFRKNTLRYKKCVREFNRLVSDKTITSIDERAEIFLKDEDLGRVSVSKTLPADEIFSLSKLNEGVSFSVSSQNQTDVSTSQIRQISGLCRFLSECLFPSKRPVQPHVSIRVNQPKENVETYSAYLSKKMAELFGVDPSGICETDYLPFLEGFGDLICEKQTTFFKNVYRRVSF